MGGQKPTDKAFMIWVPAELHHKVRQKLIADRLTARDLMIRFLEKYSGYKVEINPAVEKKDETPGQP